MTRYLITILLIIVTACGAAAQTIGGIGAQLFLDTVGGSTMPRIQSLVPKSPAYDSLKATDYIVKVNDVSCKDKTIEEVVAMIRGVVGTTVKITVADTKQGARPRNYELPRVSIQLAPPPDPAAAFFATCENEVKALRQKGAKIIKTFNSECGNYFFNFDAEATEYHVRIVTMEEKGSGVYSPTFTPGAKVFDNDNEAGATELTKLPATDGGNYMTAHLEGTVSFKRGTIGVVSVIIQDDVKKCKGMYIVVYK